MIPAYLQLIFLIVACYGLSFLIMLSLAAVSRKYLLLRVLLFPGVILHESSHALACFLTATPIDQISFWTESGGQVIHQKPRLAFLTQPFISFAPFPVGVGSLVFLGEHLKQASWIGIIFLLWLMVSIAATLAPSKTDMLHALEGCLFLAILGLLYHAIFPVSFGKFITHLTTLIHPLQIVALLLLVFWVILYLFHQSLRRRHR